MKRIEARKLIGDFGPLFAKRAEVKAKAEAAAADAEVVRKLQVKCLRCLGLDTIGIPNTGVIII